MKNFSLKPILGFIFLGLLSRFLPHPPNFTAINALALFGVASFGNSGISLLAIFITMFLSDSLLGFHSSMFFVYLSLGLITLMGLNLKKSFSHTSILLILSSLLFFIITNFGEWLCGSMYPKTLSGLSLCYFAALPFLANSLISTLLYGYVLFGWLYLLEFTKRENFLNQT